MDLPRAFSSRQKKANTNHQDTHDDCRYLPNPFPHLVTSYKLFLSPAKYRWVSAAKACSSTYISVSIISWTCEVALSGTVTRNPVMAFPSRNAADFDILHYQQQYLRHQYILLTKIPPASNCSSRQFQDKQKMNLQMQQAELLQKSELLFLADMRHNCR